MLDGITNINSALHDIVPATLDIQYIERPFVASRLARGQGSDVAWEDVHSTGQVSTVDVVHLGVFSCSATFPAPLHLSSLLLNSRVIFQTQKDD